MIVYFSATGNCKRTAEKIAESFEDKAVSIEEGITEFTLSDGEVFGIVTPVYWWQLPIIMREYLGKLILHNAGYTFLIVTYGTTPGCCGEDARRILIRRNIDLSAAFSIRMPDNFTPLFDLSDPIKVKSEVLYAEEMTDNVILKLKDRTKGNNTEKRVPYAVRLIMNPFYNYERKTKHLYADNDLCIGCGICAKKCPVGAIDIQDKKPVWVKKQCTLCLSCLHHCPKFAIHFTQGNSKNNGQYLNPNTKI